MEEGCTTYLSGDLQFPPGVNTIPESSQRYSEGLIKKEAAQIETASCDSFMV